MRSCLVSLALFVLIGIGFIVGAFANQPGLMVASFLASPLVWFIGGWAAKGLFSGRRLTFVEAERLQAEPRRAVRRAPVERQVVEETL